MRLRLGSSQEEQLVSVSEDDSSARGRKIYTLTEAGRSELQAWLEEDFEHMTTIRDPVLLRIFFGNKIPPSRLRTQLTAYRDALGRNYQDIKTTLKNIPSELKDDAFFWLMTLELGQRIHAVIIDWLNDFLEALKKRGD